MNLFVIILGSLFTFIATAIISHVSMAAALGPWIAPTIVIISGVFSRLRFGMHSQEKVNKELALIQTVGSVGGIVAMGVGFTLPMIYFLQPEVFAFWMTNPTYFCSLLAVTCICAGGVGIWLARLFAYRLITQEKLSFPVSDLIHETITAQTKSDQARQLLGGLSISAATCFLRDGIGTFAGLIPQRMYLLSSLFGKNLAFSVTPMVWAMGFIAGMGIVFPLVIGFLSKFLVLAPLNYHANYLPFSFFEPMKSSEFAQAFCSGLVLVGITFTILKLPAKMWKSRAGIRSTSIADLWQLLCSTLTTSTDQSWWQKGEPVLVLLASFLFLRSFAFGFVTQLFMLALIAIFAYQISYFSGKVGLVPFGRFTTFLMVPTMVLFGLDYLQITILCVFSNVCFGLATDLLFDYKIGQKNGLDFATIRKYQWLGLIVTSLSIGLVLWFLFNNFELGSEQLFALRARNRALLIQSIHFDYKPLILGYLFGLVLHWFRVSSMMVFGGILMPPVLTIGLVVGALFSWFDKQASEHLPFWSGFFVGESMWIMLSLAIRLI